MSEPTQPVEPVEPLNPNEVTRRVLPCALFYAVSFIGGFIGPTLVKHHPELLLAIDSRNRHLLLTTATDISSVAWFAIAATRLMLPDPFFYLLGRDFGQRGVLWIERQTQGQTGYLGWIQWLFAKISYPLILVMPNLVVCLLAGMKRVPVRHMIVLDVVGTFGRLALFWWAGQHWKDELTDALNFVQRYQWKLAAALLVLAMVQGWVRSRQLPDAA
jgi:membrane protein DedA with SNARE-associated domain